MTKQNPLVTLNKAGQSVWLDFIQRSLLESGELARLIDEDHIAGLTSNPAIFKQAIADSDDYTSAIQSLSEEFRTDSAEAVFTRLAIADIQAAADLFKPLFDNTNGEDGMVSIEVSPELARDVAGTVSEALSLHSEVNRRNVMIKVPGTLEGVEAFQQLTRKGIKVNVTLLFSVARYQDIVEAYLSGLEQRVEDGQSIAGMTSVASFFISRVDTAVDNALQAKADTSLCGKIAIANAKLAYEHYLNVFNSARFKSLQQQGALVQRLLWASTGTKNPAYSDVVYLEQLIGPDTVNTVPPKTLDAFRDHGEVAQTLRQDVEAAKSQLEQLENLGIDLEAITTTLENEGIESFASSYKELLDTISARQGELKRA